MPDLLSPASGKQGARSSVLLYGVLIAVSTIGPLAMNIFVPSIPGLMHEFSISSGTVQLTLTVYLAGFAVSQLLYGPLSDSYGRRRVLLAGLGLFIAASFLCAQTVSIETLMIARFAQAIGGAAGMVLARAIVRDLHGREAAASVLGYITMAWVLAPMFAPALGGLIEQISTWRTSFYMLAVFATGVLALAAWGLPETNPPSKNGALEADSLISGMATLICKPRFIGYTLVLGFSSAVFLSFLACAPFIMVEVLHRSPLDYGLWFILISVGYMMGNYLSGRYSQQLGINRMIALGNALAITGTLSMLIIALFNGLSPLSLFAPMLLVTLGNGLTIPNGTAAAISILPQTIGAAAGLSGFAQITIGAVASQFVGVLQGSTALAGLWTMATAAIIAGLVHLFTYRL